MEDTSKFIQDLDESDVRIAGFDNKLAAHVQKYGTYSNDKMTGWTVSIRRSLAGKTMKEPVSVTGTDKADVTKKAASALLKRVYKQAAKKGVPVLIPVESSNISGIGYSAETKTLFVEFLGGGIYQYAGVPKSKAIGIMDAASHGKYLSDEIKDRYAHTKLV